MAETSVGIQQLEWEISLLKQKKINEVLKLKADHTLQEIVITTALLRDRNLIKEKMEQAQDALKAYDEYVDEIGEKIERISDLMNSEGFDKIKYQLKSFRALKKKEKLEAKQKKIEWIKNELDRFKSLPQFAELSAAKEKKKELEKALEEKKAKEKELWESTKQEIVRMVEEWKKQCDEEKALIAKKEEEEKQKKHEFIPLRKMDFSFGLLLNVSASISLKTDKKHRRSYEKERHEITEKRRHSHESAKRSYEEDASEKENDNNSKRVRFNMNASYRSPTPESDSSSEYVKSKNMTPIPPKSPKKKKEAVFKVPTVPPVKKSILKKSNHISLHPDLIGCGMKPAPLRRTKAQNLRRLSLFSANQTWGTSNPTLSQFTREIVKSNVASSPKPLPKPQPEKVSVPFTNKNVEKPSDPSTSKSPSRSPGRLSRTMSTEPVPNKPSTPKIPDKPNTPTKKSTPKKDKSPEKPEIDFDLDGYDTDPNTDDEDNSPEDGQPKKKKAKNFFMDDNDDNLEGNSSFVFDTSSSDTFGFSNFFGETNENESAGFGLFGDSAPQTGDEPDFLK